MREMDRRKALAAMAAMPLLPVAAMLAEPGKAAGSGTVLTLEESIARRRTVRSFRGDAVSQDAVLRICWAAQGVTEKGGRKRAAPSAGALYPLELYLAAGAGGVEGLAGGTHRYLPGEHALAPTGSGDARNAIGRACLGQDWLAAAPVVFVIAARYERTTVKYGQRGERYVEIEAGAAAQGIFLQAVCLGLAAGIVGAFHDDSLAEAVGLEAGVRPLLVMPVGRQA